MCGFTGCHTPHDASLMDAALLARMTGALAHRGPDDVTLHRQPGLAFGFNRLAIIDLAGGRQPIRNEDGDIVLVCNGEIFNHRQLREELKARGHRFRAEVDVEVMVHLYEEFGLGFLDRISGQFAFALYDARRRMLLLARDPAGIAPLFYVWRRDTLLFGSEIKALLEHPLVERRIDLTGLDQVVTFPGVVSPRTLFEGVHSVSPGHVIVVQERRVTSRSYWDLDYPEERDIDPDAAADFDALNARLRHAVAERLLADVPVGLYLSGGLDSSLVAAIAGDLDRLSGSPQSRHAYSIGFSDQTIDERRQQTLIAGHVGLRHHTKVFATGDLESRLRQAVRHAESPLKESYDTCSLALSGLVRDNGEKVVLTGEGADSFLAVTSAISLIANVSSTGPATTSRSIDSSSTSCASGSGATPHSSTRRTMRPLKRSRRRYTRPTLLAAWLSSPAPERLWSTRRSCAGVTRCTSAPMSISSCALPTTFWPTMAIASAMPTRSRHATRFSICRSSTGYATHRRTGSSTERSRSIRCAWWPLATFPTSSPDGRSSVSLRRRAPPFCSSVSNGWKITSAMGGSRKAATSMRTRLSA